MPQAIEALDAAAVSSGRIERACPALAAIGRQRLVLVLGQNVKPVSLITVDVVTHRLDCFTSFVSDRHEEFAMGPIYLAHLDRAVVGVKSV